MRALRVLVVTTGADPAEVAVGERLLLERAVPAPELLGLAITRSDVAALAAFLRALNEDYE